MTGLPSLLTGPRLLRNIGIPGGRCRHCGQWLYNFMAECHNCGHRCWDSLLGGLSGGSVHCGGEVVEIVGQHMAVDR